MLIKGKTTSGFEFTIDDRVMRDLKFVRAVREWQKNNFAQIDVLERMLGADGEKKLEEHLADKDGYVDSHKAAEEMNEIFEIVAAQSDKAKNS